jgi:PhoPQ-activated pathogenicity-related protein
MIDPWVYREQITVPKMIINGANDPYWPLDALNSYWGDLKGEKYVTYVPNAGHDLREVDKDGKKDTFPMRGVNALAAFAKCQVFDKPVPRMMWTLDPKPDDPRIVILWGKNEKAGRIWNAESDSRDFRQARWVASDFKDRGDGLVSVQLAAPAKGYAATFVEMEFDVDGLTFPLTSGIVIREAKK